MQLKNQGLNYRFKLNDLQKYSQRLRPRDSSFKFERSALGKVIPEASERRKKLQNASYFTKLLKLLKHTDWQRTPIYHQYLRNKRWLHEDPNIYSELEMKYLSSTLLAMTSTANGKEFAGDEGITILAKHEEKTMHTLEVLMNQLNMMYYWEKIRLYFSNNNPSLEQLSKLMNRILKLYMLIDNFMKIFKIIEKKEVSPLNP